MPDAQAQYLLDRLRDHRATAPGEPDGWREQDARTLVLETAEYLRDALDVPALDRALKTDGKVDVDALREVAGWLAEVGEKDPVAYAFKFPDGSPFDWRQPLGRINLLLDGLADADKLEKIEVELRLNMVGDPALERLLMALRPDHQVRGQVEGRLFDKLALLPHPDAQRYWVRLRAEVDPAREVRVPPDTSVVSNDFFTIATADQAPARIAKYLSTVRPLLLRKSLETGNTQWPAGTSLGATVLAWLPGNDLRSASDQAIAHGLARVVACTPQDDLAGVADALQVPLDGYLFGGRAKAEALRAFRLNSVERPVRERAFVELEKLLRIAESRRRTSEAPLTKALRAYKLGLEVMAPESTGVLTKMTEVKLQRELCRFLVERHIIAYGTKFGWAETDIRGHDEIGSAIVETKIVRALPSSATLNRWLTQLGSYLDQEQGPVAIRGLLVLYNFTASPIFAPREELRGRYTIVTINLGTASPSKRKHSIEIAPAKGGAVVEVLAVDASPPTARKRASASTTRGNRRRSRL